MFLFPLLEHILFRDSPQVSSRRSRNNNGNDYHSSIPHSRISFFATSPPLFRDVISMIGPRRCASQAHHSLRVDTRRGGKKSLREIYSCLVKWNNGCLAKRRLRLAPGVAIKSPRAGRSGRWEEERRNSIASTVSSSSRGCLAAGGIGLIASLVHHFSIGTRVRGTRADSAAPISSNEERRRRRYEGEVRDARGERVIEENKAEKERGSRVRSGESSRSRRRG